MSSFRNAAKSIQKAHKERGQPEFRQTLGVLEKRKDYKVRARDREVKEKKIRKLKRRAEERNPDEFTRQMVVTRMEDGVHQCKELKAISDPDQIKLMHSQDERYVEHRRVIEVRKAKRLRDSLHSIEEGQRANHTFFVDGKKEMKEFDLAKRLNTHKALLDRAYNRLTLDQLREMDLAATLPDPKTMAEVMVAKAEAYRELGRREQREKQLRIVKEKLAVKKHLMDSKTKRIKVKKETRTNAAVYKWQAKRKP